MADNNDDERPATESTPLILRRRTVHTQLPSRSLPPVNPVVNRIRLYWHGIQTVDEDPSLFPPSHICSLPQQIAFKMIVLSQLYTLAKTPSMGIRTDVWEQWSGERAASLDAEDLLGRIIRVWEEFLEVSRTTEEIEECLWSPFALEKDKFRTVRVVDILKGPDAPHALISHRLITLSLSHTWTCGKAVTPVGSFFRRSLQRFRSVATPRIMHAVDVLLQLGYLALLSYYILRPPERPVVTANRILIGVREVLLMIYSIASLLRPPKLPVVPFAFVAGAFLFTLSSVPFPGDTSYSFLLGALLLHVLLLHLPQTPSPIFLFSPKVTLPLATVLWHEFTRTIYPCLLFFLPATILASFFLSIALEDSIPHFLGVFTLLEPAPMEIRMAFTVLWVILMLFIVVSAALLVLFNASFLSTSSQPICSWDRYSVAVGLRSRRTFVTAVATYSEPYYFPPPFNVLQTLFVHLPRLLLRLFGWKESPVTEQIEGVLWYLTTGPLTFVVVIICWPWTVFLSYISFPRP